MGQDKGRLPESLSGSYPTTRELAALLKFMREHGSQALVYGGGGELFTWDGAYDLIETVAAHGLRMVIFTNGTLLSRDDVARLNSLQVSLIVSLRDTAEALHDTAIGTKGFVKTIRTVQYALDEGFQHENRLAVEIPVTRDNDRRVLDEFLPIMRALRIVPIIEEYIQTSTSESEKVLCHNFQESRQFFAELQAKDREMGISWAPEYGQRIVSQPQCRRPLYSFAVFPSGDIMDCPSHFATYGNFKDQSFWDVLHSETVKATMREFALCPCSVFYTQNDDEIPRDLPEYLAAMV